MWPQTSTADSYIDQAIQGPGSVAEMAASRKEAKYAALQTHHIFQPIAVETLGSINESARAFLDDLGRHIPMSILLFCVFTHYVIGSNDETSYFVVING